MTVAGQSLAEQGRAPRRAVPVFVSARIEVAGLPVRAEWRLRQALTFRNPEHDKLVRLKKWAGRVPEHLRLYEERDGTLALPRGARATLLAVAREEGVTLDYYDKRVRPPAPKFWPDVPPAEPPYGYQEGIALDMLTRTQGLVVIPTGGGKTRTALRFLSLARTPALVLVHTKVLLDQWRAALAKWWPEVGEVSGARRVLGPVTVAMLQAADASDEAFLHAFGAVIVDEAHHVAASTFCELVGRFPAKFRFGLTATPDRADGLGAVVEAVMDEPVAVVTPEDLIARGVIVRPRVVRVPTAFWFDYDDALESGASDAFDAAKWQALLAALTADPARNALIARLAAEAEGGVGAILSDRVEHCRALCGLLAAKGVPARVVLGGREQKKAEREAALAGAREGAVRWLVGTKVIGEGFDLPDLATVILATPTRSKVDVIQKVGRALRAAPGKRAVVYDLDDRLVRVLHGQYEARRRLYRKVYGVEPVDREEL